MPPSIATLGTTSPNMRVVPNPKHPAFNRGDGTQAWTPVHILPWPAQHPCSIDSEVAPALELSLVESIKDVGLAKVRCEQEWGLCQVVTVCMLYSVVFCDIGNLRSTDTRAMPDARKRSSRMS